MLTGFNHALKNWPLVLSKVFKHVFNLQDEGVRGRKRKKRPSDPRPRQEKQPLGRKGQMRHHVEFHAVVFEFLYNNFPLSCVHLS